MLKHITEYNYDMGHSFNGFRVSMLKKGIEFRKYVSSKGIGRTKALARAIELEGKLSSNLKGCNTLDELLEFKKIWEN